MLRRTNISKPHRSILQLGGFVHVCLNSLTRCSPGSFCHFYRYSVREFVDACIEVTGVNITVVERDARAGDAAEVYDSPRTLATIALSISNKAA